jgi:predicted nucleotidyltransferase
MDALARRLLEEHAEVAEVVVFGSFAEGNYAPGSDLDLLIVLSRSTHPVRDRIPLYMPDQFPVPLDLFPFTREELATRRDSPVVQAANRSCWRYMRV